MLIFLKHFSRSQQVLTAKKLRSVRFSTMRTVIRSLARYGYRGSLLQCDWYVFLPRDAMHKRGICRYPVSVCLSVRHVRELRQNE